MQGPGVCFCQDCGRHADCFLATASAGCKSAWHDIARHRLTNASGERPYRLGEPCTPLFQVSRGSIQTQRDSADGDLIVTGFYLPGDLVGIDALADRSLPSNIIACGDSSPTCTDASARPVPNRTSRG